LCPKLVDPLSKFLQLHAVVLIKENVIVINAAARSHVAPVDPLLETSEFNCSLADYFIVAAVFKQIPANRPIISFKRGQVPEHCFTVFENLVAKITKEGKRAVL